MIKISNLSKKYGKNSVLKNINYEIKQGTNYLIVGNNGSGKSTLLKILLGIIKKYSGVVNIDEKPIGFFPQDALVAKDIYVKDFFNLMNELTEKEQKSLDKNALSKKFDCEHLLHKNFGKLSHGETKRVLLAATFMHDKYMLFDEPTNGLDAKYKKVFIEEIKKRYSEQNFIIATHDFDLINELDFFIVTMKNGEFICELVKKEKQIFMRFLSNLDYDLRKHISKEKKIIDGKEYFAIKQDVSLEEFIKKFINEDGG
ncbi:ABC transporter ATP-binding protein [Candidatus Woesearchaeota archaeon]|nr:ABC transporter ATP-binding protein [Candidatus Woesearchaeota archaeon]